MPGPPRPDLCDRFANLRAALRAGFIERDALIDASLAALVAGQHVLVVGPPGTAKSLLAQSLCGAIDGAVYFQWLLTRFTVPEELFGPVSLAELERDRYVRLTDGKLPRAHVVFLDEVFKASSAILNALLTLLNERKFHNGGRVEDAPLGTLFGASNELPDEDELQALYDRFLVRVAVDYVEEDFRFLKLLVAPPPSVPVEARLTLDDVNAARLAAARLEVPNTVIEDVAGLRRQLAERGIVASDRRWRLAIGFLRAWAWLDGRDSVRAGDLYALEHVLWSNLDDRDELRVVLDELVAGELAEVRKLVFEAREISAYPQRFIHDTEAVGRAALEAYTKLNLVLDQAVRRVEAARRRGRELAELHAGVREITRLRDDVVAAHLKQPLQ